MLEHLKEDDNGVASALKFAELNQKIETVELPDGKFAVVLPRGKEIKSVKGFIDEYKSAPDRHFGTSTHETPASLIEHVNAFKTESSVLFANMSRKEPAIQAVYNYRTPAAPSKGDWMARMNFTLSDQWKEWTKQDGQMLGQDEFAEFIEAHADDVVSPPESADESFAGTRQLAIMLGLKIATQFEVINLSRGLEINSEFKAKNIVNPGSGERQIQFTSSHSDVGGQKLTIPGLFLIAIPVFQNGMLFRMPVRLKYRIKDETIKWGFNIYQPEKNFDAAYTDECGKIADNTGLPIFFGRPE